MERYLPEIIFAAGIGQLGVLVATALVPFRLNWRTELQCLPRLHQQMYLVYGGYIVLSIAALGLICVVNATELAAGGRLARSFCVYGAAFWGIRLLLQGVFDVKPHLTTWWLKAGYHGLTLLFLCFTAVYAWAAFGR
jgi:hypothetical protein